MDFLLNGKNAFAATGGREFDPALPSVVLIHGAGFDHTAWALHSRYFAHHGCSVLVPDLPGHGRSQGPALRTIGEMADWIAALLEAARATKARLIGHSMGSLIALETAVRHPEKVSALGLIGTSAAMTIISLKKSWSRLSSGLIFAGALASAAFSAFSSWSAILS